MKRGCEDGGDGRQCGGGGWGGGVNGSHWGTWEAIGDRRGPYVGRGEGVRVHREGPDYYFEIGGDHREYEERPPDL